MPTGMGQSAALQVGDDLFDDCVITVLGLGGQHRGGRVGEDRVLPVRREQRRARRVRRAAGWDRIALAYDTTPQATPGPSHWPRT